MTPERSEQIGTVPKSFGDQPLAGAVRAPEAGPG